MRSGDLAQGHLHTKALHWLHPNFLETVQMNSLPSQCLFLPFLFQRHLYCSLMSLSPIFVFFSPTRLLCYVTSFDTATFAVFCMKHLHFQLKMRNSGTIILETLGDCGRNSFLLLSSHIGPGNVWHHVCCRHLSCKYSLNTASL